MIFQRSLLTAQRIGIRGIRHNSSLVGKATSYVNCAVSKATGLVNCSIYWSKVVAELGKQIYIKEGLAPPAGSTFKEVYKSLYEQALQLSKQPNASLESAITFAKSLGKPELVKYGSITVQLLGLFSLGEIIGRRHIIGYPNFSKHH